MSKTRIIPYAIVLAWLLFFFSLFSVNTVYGASMEPTICDGDMLISSRFRTPEFRDIVIYRVDRSLRVKRVIGCPGDLIRFDQGALYRNGEIVQLLIESPSTESFDLKIPDDSYFVVGDNMAISADSRNLGCIKRTQIIGCVLNRR